MTDDAKPFHNPFAILSGLRDTLPAQPAQPAPDTNAPVELPPSAKRIPRAVVRLERSGRGGKEVTVVEHMALAPAERESWLKMLKAALGCGGSIEGYTFVLQGDQRQRLRTLLSARGVKKITVA